MKSIENESLIGFTVSIEENYLKLELSESFEQLLVVLVVGAGYKPSVQVSPLVFPALARLGSQFILFLFFL